MTMTEDVAEQISMLAHKINTISLRMFNSRKRLLNEEEVLKMLLIQATLEELIEKLNED